MKLTKNQTAFIREFLSYCRPHGSSTEKQFISRFLLSCHPATYQDGFGNIHLDLRADKSHRTLFVGHTDTVHRRAGFQRVLFDKTSQTFTTTGECLGADDGAGLLVLLHLIASNVPAYYIFTRCEERGGQGAKHLLDYHSDLLCEFDRAIAFDRKGTSSVITHQGWGRCCSDEFADALCDALDGPDLMYAPDDTGVYTDTAEFVDLIPECTNVSVGYFNEHRPIESLDGAHLLALMEQVTRIEWDQLPTARDPYATEASTAYDWYTWDSDGLGGIRRSFRGLWTH